MHNITLSLLLRETLSRGQWEKRVACVGPRVDLPLHCYLLLRHKGAPWWAASGRKARRRMSQLELRREEDPRLSPMTTLSSMNTIYATGSLFSNRPPPGPSSSPRALATFTGNLLVSCVLPHPFLSLFPLFIFLQTKSREMLPKHCKLIMALNIYYMMVGGLHGGDVRERERAGGRNVGSSSGSSLWSHTLSVSWGTCTRVSQRNR